MKERNLDQEPDSKKKEKCKGCLGKTWDCRQADQAGPGFVLPSLHNNFSTHAYLGEGGEGKRRRGREASQITGKKTWYY